MRRLIFALPLLLALPTTARADPKEITLDGCAKVEQEILKDHDRTTISVKCIGEAFDPQIRKSQVMFSPTSIILTPNRSSCVNSAGEVQPC